MFSKKSPEGTKKVAGGCGCQPLVRLAWLFPPPEPIQQRRRHQKPNKEDRLKPVLLLRRKRAAAAAVARRVGILEDESLAHQRLFVLERSAVQIQKTFRVDEEARAELFEDFVAVAGLGVPPHGIGEAGTAAALHAYAQASDIGRHAVLFEQRAYFPRGAFGQVDFRDVWACDFSCHFKCYKAFRVQSRLARGTACCALQPRRQQT